MGKVELPAAMEVGRAMLCVKRRRQKQSLNKSNNVWKIEDIYTLSNKLCAVTICCASSNYHGFPANEMDAQWIRNEDNCGGLLSTESCPHQCYIQTIPRSAKTGNTW